MITADAENRFLTELDQISSEDRSARAVRLLAAHFKHYKWVGIYWLEENTLVLGPFVGAPTEHDRIPVGRGVCGTAVAEKRNQVIGDVRCLDNYLACSVETRSEIVVLIRRDGKIIGQIDVDGHEPDAFDASDEALLMAVADRLAAGDRVDSSAEIVSSRVFPAPREAVFAAVADPVRLAKWWGPKGFTNSIHEFDLRPGGWWRLTLHGPNGAVYHNESKFVEVTAPARIILDHIEPVHRFRMTMSFDDEGGKTRLTWRMCFESADEANRVREFIVRANEENFDRLEAVLAETQ